MHAQQVNKESDHSADIMSAPSFLLPSLNSRAVAQLEGAEGIEGEDALKSFLTIVALLALVWRGEAATIGGASYYGAGGRAATGGRAGGFTAAHRTLPFGTRVRVTNLKNNHSVIVTINDRGPFAHGRVIDVSPRAARALGFRTTGVTQVKIEVVGAEGNWAGA